MGIQPNIRLNPVVLGLLQSATLAINERAGELEAGGRRVFRLGFGQSPFPVPDVVVESLRQNAHQKAYLPVRGLRQLREAVARYHAQRTGQPHRAEDVIIGPGSKELMYILQVVFDGVLNIPSPTWLSYAPQALIARKQVRWIPTTAESDWLLTPDDVETIGRTSGEATQMVILNYPGNPSGTTYTDEELRDIAEAARRHNLLIVSDEIYGELDHDGSHTSLATYYPDGTIVSAGLSKWCGAGGWRLGTFTFSPEMPDLLAAVATVAGESFSSTSAPIQYAAVTAYNGGPEIDQFLSKSRRILGALGRTVTDRLRAAGADVCQPGGGYYIMPGFDGMKDRLASRGMNTSPDLCEQMLEKKGVALLPASAFGRPAEELSVRLAYVDFDGSRALAALPSESEPDEAFLQDHCGTTLEGVDRICEFLAG